MNEKTILNFWFVQLSPSQWWEKNTELDEFIKNEFGGFHERAIRGELCDWRESAEGVLAEVLILDQFSRNIFRNKALSFAYDGMALTLAQEGIRRGMDKQLSPVQSSFLYMPFMHSESLKMHHKAFELFAGSGMEKNLAFEKQHAEIIERFGRYPHRNEILGRESTKEEKQFLRDHSGF